MDRSDLKDILVRNVKMDGTDWLVDAVIAAGAFGFGLLQLTVSANLFIPDDFMRRILGIAAVTPSAFAILGTLLTSLPVMFRRKFPWLAFLISSALWLAFELNITTVPLSLVSPLIALFTLALYRPRSETFIASFLLFVSVILSPSIYGSTTLSSLMLMQNIVLVIAAALAGYALHTRQDYLEAAEARAVEAERLRESEEKRAEQAEETARIEAERRIEEERVKIAREVHDITAHSLSAVSIQAAAAERLIQSDPKAAEDAIATVRTTAKEALEEMRTMVGLLRSGNDSKADTTPTQGTDQLPSLRQYLENAGIHCVMDTSKYDNTSVPTYIDVALYGIAREASTNIVRHSKASNATINLWTSKKTANLCVEDDGIGIEMAPGLDIPQNGGQGLRGMQERVNLLGGAFDMNQPESGGLKINISIPIAQK